MPLHSAQHKHSRHADTLQCHHFSVRATADGTRLRQCGRPAGRPHGPVFILVQGAVPENDQQAYSRFTARSGKCMTQLHHETNAAGYFKQVPKFRTHGDLPPRQYNSSVVFNEEKGPIYIFLRDFRLPQRKSALFCVLNAA
jgi:hypothetical protein